MKTDLAFKLGTGEVDDMCYDFASESSKCVLNRHGVVRLFSTFSRQCPSFKLSFKWDSIKNNVGVPLNTNYKRNDEVLPKVNRGTYTAPRAASHNAVVRHPSPPRPSSTTYAQAAAAVYHIPRLDSTTARQ